ncbi:hypothetical protein ACSW8S_19150 (plasmid) [Clostridium perfringens]
MGFMQGIKDFKDKVNNFTSEESQNISKSEIQPRNSKGVVVGAPKGSEKESVSQNRILDTSDDICVIRGIQLVEDNGNYMISVIERLEKGQLLVVDFSESDDRNREIQFHVLWGAVMAFHGSYKMLDKAGNLVLFTSQQNKIAEDRSQRK